MDVWTAQDGLPPRDIHSIAQTPDGYLWLASYAGVIRFDGVQFKVYHSRNTTNFNRSMARSLFVSREGELWLGTNGDGFGRFQDGKYAPIPLQPGSSNWSEHLNFTQTRDGRLWVGGYGDHSLVQVNGRAVHWDKNATHGVTGIVEGDRGTLWISHEYRGLMERDANGRITLRSPQFNISGNASAILRTQAGDWWIGSINEGLFRQHKGVWTRYTTREGLGANNITKLLQDRAGNLWIGTTNGLSRWREGRGITSFRKEDGLPLAGVTALFEDREGSLWVGNESRLARFRNTKWTPLEARVGYEPASLNDMTLGRDGAFWIATMRGLFRSNGRDLPTRVHTEPTYSVWEDDNGTLWTANTKSDLRVYRDGALAALPAPLQGVTGVNWGSRAKGGMVFSGTGPKLAVIDPVTILWRWDGKRITPIRSERKTGYVFGFYTDRKGTLWATCENGIARIEGAKAEVLYEGLPPNAHVLGALDAGEFGFWVSTDHGLARREGERFVVYGRAAGLPEENLFQVQCDAQGRLWIGCNSGVFVLKREDIERFDQRKIAQIPYVLYTESDGVRHPPTVQKSLLAQDGTLWFRGEKGVTLVKPDAEVVNKVAPNVILERLLVGGAETPIAGTIKLTPGQREVEIRYTGTSLLEPGKARFRYMLDGYDKDWVEAGERRVAYYTNLPPGNYTFRVIGCNNDGVWNRKPVTLTFKLPPFCWQTLWFKALCGVGFALCLGVGVRWRMRQLERRNQLLERKIAERTSALEEAKTQLESSHDELEAAFSELEATNAELEATNQELAEVNAKLEALATTDGMTGLFNHRAFQERLRIEFVQSQRTERPLSLLMLDVDRFKQYNDAFGHPAGDEVLRLVGRLIRETLRPYDIPARYGGEEFAVLLPGADRQEAAALAERMRATIEGYVFPNREITVSVGVVAWTTQQNDVEAFMEAADRALYQAKRNGRNQVCLSEGAEPAIAA